MPGKPKNQKVTDEELLALASAVLDIESRAVDALRSRLNGDFVAACQLCLDTPGRVVVTGMGKSGHVSNKIAATLASTGTPAFFMHPAEASHGDLGMITSQDLLLAISYSGETAEVVTILPVVKRMGAKLLSITGNPKSTMALAADVHLDVSVEEEACSLNLGSGELLSCCRSAQGRNSFSRYRECSSMGCCKRSRFYLEKSTGWDFMY